MKIGDLSGRADPYSFPMGVPRPLIYEKDHPVLLPVVIFLYTYRWFFLLIFQHWSWEQYSSTSVHAADPHSGASWPHICKYLVLLIWINCRVSNSASPLLDRSKFVGQIIYHMTWSNHTCMHYLKIVPPVYGLLVSMAWGHSWRAWMREGANLWSCPTGVIQPV